MPGAFLPPDTSSRDPLAAEIAAIRRSQGLPPPNLNETGQRFLPPGGLSRKAQQAHARGLPSPPTDTLSVSPPPVESSSASASPPANGVYTPPPTISTPEVENVIAAPTVPSDPDLVSPSLVQPSHQSAPCTEGVFVRIGSVRLVVECGQLAPHPGQAHLTILPSIEEGDQVFLGWWRESDP